MRKILFVLFLAASVWAESFGGLGVTIQSSPKGVQIVTVIPGSPASANGLEPGDQIMSVNGKALEGIPLEEATALLRGEAGTKVTLAVSKAKDGEIKAPEFMRANLQVQTLSLEELGMWYGGAVGLTQEDVAHFAETKALSGFALMGVLQYGKLLEAGSKVAPQQVSSVYLGASEPPKPSVRPALLAKIGLLSFSPERISLHLNTPGSLELKVLDLQGKLVARWEIPNAPVGSVHLGWKGTAPAKGSYGLFAKQGSAQASWEVQLK